MSNYDQIGALYDKAEKLIGVRYSVFDAGLDGKDWVEAVEMRFESTVATVYVESDFDTLCLELREMKVGSDCYIKDATSVKPWDGALGRQLSWIWSLRNQQGYEDGLRFEFSSKEKETPTIITFIGMASSIQMYLSQEFVM
jgi:hypothetical protein